MDKQSFIERHLLVIDDEEEITRSLFRQFRKQYKVHTATSGIEAINLMEENPIQVVLSDQRMPGMTGVDFFSKIKNKYPDALKLILTGYSDIEAVVGAINDGQVFRYLTKPWNPVELDLAIEEAFEKHDLITNNRKLMQQLHDANVFLEEKVKERTSELEKANHRLKALNIEKNKYVGIVAHDLRNPIGNIFSFTDLLISDYDSFTKEDQIKFLKIANKQCLFSMKLIEEFLDSSKIEAGILDLNFTEVDFNNLISESISNNYIFAIKKQQTITFIPAKGKKIVCDNEKMLQVINNLLSNAIKYSEKNTTIEVTSYTENNTLITQVADQGIGIKEDEIANVFKIYHTTTSKATEGEKSTGLGLAIVKKIVESHGGEINVESQPGIGTTFTFTLPIIQTN